MQSPVLQKKVSITTNTNGGEVEVQLLLTKEEMNLLRERLTKEELSFRLEVVVSV